MEITEDQRRNYLRDEYLFLQSQYEDYDKRSLLIKGWVSSGAIAALALSMNVSRDAALFVTVIVVVVVSVTWYLESYWKVFQYAFADRIQIIEAYFRGDSDVLIKNPHPFQIYHWWYESYSNDAPIFGHEKSRDTRPRKLSTRLRQAALHRFVYLPYLPILVLSAASFAFLLLRNGK
jgi:hypothetical protein